jgi:uncharacterized protein YbjT (DUF2867 family)
MVRVEAKGADLPPTVKHVVGTFDDPPNPEVLQTFDRIFLLSPMHEAQVELEVLFIDALIRAGHAPRVVKVAADGFQDPDCSVRFMRNHREIATHLEATELPVSYLAPSMYMENLVSAADPIRMEATVPAPAGDGRIGFIAAKDVAAVAAQLLTSEDPEDRIYVLTGPEALSYAEIAERISAVSSGISCEKAVRLLGWKPKRSWRQFLDEDGYLLDEVAQRLAAVDTSVQQELRAIS